MLSLHQNKKIISPVITTLFVGLLSTFSFGATPEQRGLEIAIEVDKRDNGFNDNTSTLEMILGNKYGESTTRIMRTKTLEQEDDGDKSQITFDNPRDVKGTSFLSFTHKVGSDDQWLYLPGLKRVKRISSSNKSGPFMGSEFAFEDISSQEVEKYTYKYLKEEKLMGRDTYLLERDPVDPKSGYTKQNVWIDKERYIALKIDFYDRKSSLLKTLTIGDYNQYLDKFWRANKWEMVNHQTGKTTLLNYSNWNFRTGLKDKNFTKNSLKRSR